MPNDRKPFRGGAIAVQSNAEFDTIIGVAITTPGGEFLTGEMRVTALKFSNENGKEKIEIVLTGFDMVRRDVSKRFPDSDFLNHEIVG